MNQSGLRSIWSLFKAEEIPDTHISWALTHHVWTQTSLTPPHQIAVMDASPAQSHTTAWNVEMGAGQPQDS